MTAAPNFDRVARLYRWAEYLTLGPLLERTRTHFLPQLNHAQHALILGDGDGRFLAKLLTRNQTLHATAVDTSKQMLALLRRRCAPASARLEIIQTNALTYTPPPNTDLIVTHFFLDCFTQTEINALTLRLAQPETLWLLSDFRIPTGPLRPIARVYIRSLYFAFRILTGLQVNQLPDPAHALTAAGFHRIAHHQTLGGILYTELWQCDGLQSTKQSADAIRQQNETMDDANTNRPAPHFSEDALPDPEPAAPSLSEPDPGVFHHQPGPQPPKSKDAK